MALQNTSRRIPVDGRLSHIDGAGVQSVTATGAITLDDTYSPHLRIDPGGAARDLTLPEGDAWTGCFLTIVNTADAAETITVKQDSDTIGTVPQNFVGVFYFDGTTWILHFKFSQVDT